MAEYITKKAAIKAVENAPIELFQSEWEEIEEAINAAPTADVAPVVHGWWISFLDGDHIMPERYYRCSRCGRVESRRQPYCHCGAEMDGGTDND